MPKHPNVAKLLPHQIRHTELSDGRLPCLPAKQFVPFYFLNTNLSQITQITHKFIFPTRSIFTLSLLSLPFPPCSHFLSGFVYTITKSRIICHIWFRTPYYHHQDQMNLVFHGSLMTLDNRSDLIRYIILSLIIALVLQFIWKPPK